jgi:hypothetical protein
VIQNDKPSLPVCAFGAGAAHAAVLALILPVMITLPAPKDEARGTVAIQVAVRTAPSTPFIQAAMAHAETGMPQAVLEGEGDVDEGSWPVLEAEDATEGVTGALPEIPEEDAVVEPATLMEQAALSAPAEDVTGALPEISEQAAAEPAPLLEQAALAALAEAAPTAEVAPPVDAAEPVAVPEAVLVRDAPAPVIEEEVALATVASTETTLAEAPDFMPDVVPRPLRRPPLPAVTEVVHDANPKPAPRPRVTTRARPQPPAKPFKGLLGGTRATPMEEFPFRAGR